MNTLEQVKEIVENKLRILDELKTAHLDKFKAELDKNPAHAFYWAEDTMRRIAVIEEEHKIFKMLDLHIKDGKDLKWIIEWLTSTKKRLTDDVLIGATHTNKNTLQTANMMNEFHRAGKAEVLKNWQFFILNVFQK